MNTDILSEVQKQMMNAIRDEEDRRVFWHLRIAEMDSARQHREPIEAIYLLVLKYGANLRATKRGENTYEIELECNEYTHGDWAFQYFLRPKCSPTK